ncbi:MAG: hypothetical protein IEMM0002_0591 [bacterium]|nr:MAG: hypothetical protein IEMM0002_0591 [bacterium]
MVSNGTLGLIAGRGELSRIVCETAKKRGVPVSAVAFDAGTAKQIQNLADVKFLGLGQADTVINRFKDAGVRDVCLIGKIEKKLVFNKINFDLRGLKVMKKLMSKSDTDIMLAIIEELENEGFEVAKQSDWLPELLVEKGTLGNKKPAKNVLGDFEFGLGICRELASKDIGQIVVIKDGVVLAVEAVEGTNAAIERGCRLGGKGAVMVKTSRPNQDFRFDIPSVGPDTVRLLADHKAAGLAIEATRTLVINLPETISICNRAGIVFAAM